MKALATIGISIGLVCTTCGAMRQHPSAVLAGRAAAIARCARVAAVLHVPFVAAGATGVHKHTPLAHKGYWIITFHESSYLVDDDGKALTFEDGRRSQELANAGSKQLLHRSRTTVEAMCEAMLRRLGGSAFVPARDWSGQPMISKGQGTIAAAFDERPYGFPSMMGGNYASFQVDPHDLAVVSFTIHTRCTYDPPKIKLGRAQAVIRWEKESGRAAANPHVNQRYLLPNSSVGAKAAYYHDHWRARLVYEVSDGKTMAGIDAEDGSLMERATVVRLVAPKKHGAPAAGPKG